MIISALNLGKCYGKQHALKNISFELKKGDLVGLLGVNGAGKSTLMKILSGVIKPTEGTASIMGLLPGNINIKRKVGYLPENNPLFYDMYVIDFLYFMSEIVDVNPTNIKKIIQQLGLEGILKKKIDTLSKGYRQRVGLAHVLLQNPEILILDEPTTGLDPNQILSFRSLIKAISIDKTVILATHILQEVESLCNRVLLLHQGAIKIDKPLEIIKKEYETLDNAFKKQTKETSNLNSV